MKQIHNNLREYRLKVNLTQKQVASLLKLHCEDRLSQWEQGKATPSVVNLFKLAEIYQVNPVAIYPEITKSMGEFSHE